MALFVSVLLISNIASSAKIVDWGISIGPLALAFDAGTLLFPISYIFGDVLTEVYGYKRSRRVIWAGFGASALMALTLWLVSVMPGEAEWQKYAGQQAYNAILGGVSTGGIIIASLVAYFAGEFSNSVLMAKMKIWTKGRFLWSRTIGSTLVGQAVDTSLFIVIAAVFNVFPWVIVPALIVSNYIFKVCIETFMTPLTYQVIGVLKRVEQEDYYDYETSFNPFNLRV
nr:queuosine precursor transporter [Anaerolineae bacterium]